MSKERLLRSINTFEKHLLQVSLLLLGEEREEGDLLSTFSDLHSRAIHSYEIAIDLLEKKKISLDNPLISKLTGLVKALEYIHREYESERLARGEKLDEETPSLPPSEIRVSLDWVKTEKGDVVKSGHSVVKATVSPNVSSDISGETVYYKQNNPILCQCEAAFGDCYRLILGGITPKTRAVYDSDGKVTGLCSTEIPEFTDARALKAAAKWMKKIKWDTLTDAQKEQFELSTETFHDVKLKTLCHIAKKHEMLLDPNNGNLNLDNPNLARGEG